jgi:F420-dependent oxidoreductase-like protein
MQFGIQHPNFSYDGEGVKTIDTLSTLAKTGESLGFDSFWVMDHFHQISYVGDQSEPMFESWTTIAVLAGMTSKIKLGTLVTGNSYRYPSVLAKMGATMDVLSKGRLFFGIGAAWNDVEAHAYGIPFPPTGERLARLEEAVQIVRMMWTEDETNFDGKYYKLEKALCNPKPIQKPTPKILIGGSGEKFTLRTVAKYGDACNLFGSPETVKTKLAVLRKHCDDVGRDYDSILKTKLTQVLIGEDEAEIKPKVSEVEKVMPPGMLRETMIYGTPEQVQKQIEEFSDAGVQYLIISFGGPDELQSLRLFGETILPRN